VNPNSSMTSRVSIRIPPTLQNDEDGLFSERLADIVASVVNKMKIRRSWVDYDPEEALPELPWNHPPLVISQKMEDTGGTWFTVPSRRRSRK
jgi:hypothetical protein